jgi:amino acid adenylation domain-containing protein
MKTIHELLSYLQSKKVTLWVDGDNLRYRAPKEALTQEIKEKLRQHKAEILSFLNPSGMTSIQPIADNDHYELSHAQKRLWVLSQIEKKGSAAYNIPLSLLIEGDLDKNVLQRSLTHVVKRHESLRTRFITIDGEPRQQVHKEIDFHVQWIDMSLDAQSEKRARELIRKEAMTPFDLETGPLLRVLLIKLAQKQHVLMVTMHHIISDGWSLSVLVREFGMIYRALHKGQQLSLPALPVQYRDYASWQNQLLERETVAFHRQYWHQKLSGKIPVLNLPADFPRPVEQTFNGKIIAFSLDKFLTDRLLSFSHQQNTTLFMTLVAAVKALLYRYTGGAATAQEDIIVGVPIAGRNHMDLEGQIGLYLNTLVLRDTVQGQLSFISLVQQVKQTMTEAYDHQVYPFDLLVRELELHRDLSRSPLFDVMVILQNAGNLELSLEGLKIHPFFEDPGISKFDLTFDFSEKVDGLQFGIEYNTDLFTEERIQRMGSHFIELIKAIVADANQPIDYLKLLSDSEYKQILYGFNNTEASYPKDKTLVDLFELQVEQTPDAVAVVFENQQLTYRQLNSHANQLAYHLQALGVGPKMLVGICVERSLQMLYGLLGILKAGTAYVPVDPTYPKERLALMLQDVSILVTQEHLIEKLPPLKAQVVCLNGTAPFTSGSQEGIENPKNGRAKADDSAYVIYTSGSTGKPKGVEIPHRCLVNFLVSMAKEPGLTEKDVLMAVTTLSFDIAALELYLPLIAGARVVIASRDTARDGTLLMENMDRACATIMQATPSTWRLLLSSSQWNGNKGLKILCGGEALHKALATQLLQKGHSVWNLYGPTETTIWSTVYQVKGQSEEEIQQLYEASVPIGSPIANTQVYILDKTLQPVPIGIVGELHIGGAGVAKGYLNQPELTAEKFIPDPFASCHNRNPNLYLYKTGDLASFLPDGNILFLGRMDQQVKIRGYRIEPGEIECLLRGHPALDEALVVVLEKHPDDKALAAYVVTKSGHSPALIPELRDFLREKVPDYMIPSSFILLDALPLTPNGKVNRQALPLPDKSRSLVSNTSYVAPQNDVQQAIVTAWQEILGIDKIGIHDNFFDLGGHSLNAAKVVFRIQKNVGIDLNLIDIFRHPTIAALWQSIQKMTQSDFGGLEPIEKTTDTLLTEWDHLAPATDEEIDMLDV